MILIIDNYDSFTYNLVQAIESLGAETKVVMNDELSPEDVRAMNPEGIVLSPGPCTPEEAGICKEVVKGCHKDIPILGVCLGHQVIGSVFNSKIVRAENVLHGKIDQISHLSHPFFSGVPDKFDAVRYHSLVIESDSLGDELEILADSSLDGSIMAVKHKMFDVYGLQFHPESYATPDGMTLLNHFITITRKKGDILS